MRHLFYLAFIGLPLWGAETIVTQRIHSQNRLIPLKKITIGPDDQYHGAVDPGGDWLAFTRKTDLVPHLCKQNLKTGDVSDLLPLSADSQEPAISPEGLLAFTYHKFNARGDICYRSLEDGSTSASESGISKEMRRSSKQNLSDDKVLCLKADEGERSSPFWKGAKELGYVLRNLRTSNNQIIVQNIETGTRTVLAEGRVWSPAMKPNGQYLFYNELVPPKSLTDNTPPSRGLVMKDLKTGVSRLLRFQLPGFSGFPSVSQDETRIYFSHYLNDTNNDNVIDANDNSVVFSASIAALQKGGNSFPEQLTSAESNCSFPRPSQDQLYVTCGFEGSLDIYRIPNSGVVPKNWTSKLLLDAHQTSRTYQERILVLNTLKFRFGEGALPLLEERLFSNHLLADDLTATRYYLDHLVNVSRPSRKQFYHLINLYLSARTLKKSQPADEEVSRKFVSDILEIDSEVSKTSSQGRVQKLIRGMLRTFVNQPQQAMSFLKEAEALRSERDPLERYFYYELANWTLPRVSPKNLSEMANTYHEMMGAKELSHENKIFYAFQFLNFVESKIPQEERSVFIQKANHDLPETVSTLLKSEIATLDIIRAPERAAKDELYRKLDQLMSNSRADYFLRKALYVRSIVNFAGAGEFRFLNFVATNWLRYTGLQDAEFSHAREVYIHSALDQAYDNFGAKKYELAGNYFYDSLSLTDDLESHYGYIKSMVLRGQRKTLDDRYQNLKNREFIADNIKFVEALLILLDATPDARETKHLDQAIERLASMENDTDAPVRYLLLGYCYLDKLMRLADGYTFERNLFDNAHKNLMLAYDIGRGNARIQAAALMDLGLLHQRVQNHGLAVKFFTKRKTLGFLGDEEAVRFAWVFSRSLFYSNQPELAEKELGSALDLKQTQVADTPLLERRAFYLQASRNFAEAVKIYQKLLRTDAVKGDLNLAKVYLSYGYCLLKVKQESGAQAVLKRSIEFMEKLPAIQKGGDRLVDFQPIRLKMVAYGLLSQVGSTPDRLAALEKRRALLEEASKLNEDHLALVIQNRLQAAHLYTQTDPASSAKALREALALAEQLGDSAQGQFLTRAVYQTTLDFLAHGFQYPEFYSSSDRARAATTYQKSIQAYAAQPPQPVWESQKLKLKMLWVAYNAKMNSQKPNADEIRNLAQSAPSRELTSLAEALVR